MAVSEKLGRLLDELPVLRDAVEVIRRYPVERAVLFGSRARGDGSARSDIDIAVFCSRPEALSGLFSELDELDTLLKIDLVAVTENTSHKLLEDIERDGVVLVDRLETKLANLERAVLKLREAAGEYARTGSEVVRDGVIQRFEFTCELAWKATREYLAGQGFVELSSPKAVMKEAFSAGVVEDGELWVRILNDRNLTSHVYSEQVANEVCARIVDAYLPEFERLLKCLTERRED